MAGKVTFTPSSLRLETSKHVLRVLSICKNNLDDRYYLSSQTDNIEVKEDRWIYPHTWHRSDGGGCLFCVRDKNNFRIAATIFPELVGNSDSRYVEMHIFDPYRTSMGDLANKIAEECNVDVRVLLP